MAVLTLFIKCVHILVYKIYATFAIARKIYNFILHVLKEQCQHMPVWMTSNNWWIIVYVLNINADVLMSELIFPTTKLKTHISYTRCVLLFTISFLWQEISLNASLLAGFHKHYTLFLWLTKVCLRLRKCIISNLFEIAMCFVS